jgi:hypothetical protein
MALKLYVDGIALFAFAEPVGAATDAIATTTPSTGNIVRRHARELPPRRSPPYVIFMCFSTCFPFHRNSFRA